MLTILVNRHRHTIFDHNTSVLNILQQEAMTQILRDLSPNDLFNVIAFEGAAHVFSPSMMPATQENIHRAGEYILGLNAIGGTVVIVFVFVLFDYLFFY